MQPPFGAPATVPASTVFESSLVGWAVFSRDRTKRYALGRRLAGNRRVLVVCGLNPSKAGALAPDMTVTKVNGFAHRHGCAATVMVNIEPAISTNPKLCEAGASDEDDRIVGAILRNALEGAEALTVAAWGSSPMATEARMRALLGMLPGPVHCFGTTADGMPRHLSRLAYATPLVPWRPPWEGKAA